MELCLCGIVCDHTLLAFSPVGDWFPLFVFCIRIIILEAKSDLALISFSVFDVKPNDVATVEQAKKLGTTSRESL